MAKTLSPRQRRIAAVTRMILRKTLANGRERFPHKFQGIPTEAIVRMCYSPKWATPAMAITLAGMRAAATKIVNAERAKATRHLARLSSGKET